MKASNLAPKNRLRRRQKDGIAPADAMSPLDSDEQEEVVANLAQEAWRQTALIKRGFFGMLVLLNLAAVRSLFQLLWTPDKVLPNRNAPDTSPSVWFLVACVGHLFGLYFALGVAQGNRRLVFPGMVVSSTNFVFWLAVLAWHRVTNPLSFLIPLSPAVAVGMSLYVLTSERTLGREIEELKRLQYNHKKL